MNSDLNSLNNRGESLDSKYTQSITDWVFEVESFLNKSNLQTEEIDRWIKKVKIHGFTFNEGDCLTSYHKQQNYSVLLPPITKRNQMFVELWFNIYVKFYNLFSDILKSLSSQISMVLWTHYGDLLRVTDNIVQEYTEGD